MRMATWCHPVKAGRSLLMAARLWTVRCYGRATAVSNVRFFQPSPLRCALLRHFGPSKTCHSKAVWNCTSPTTKNLAAQKAPAGCLDQGITKPDLMIAAGFSYQVVTAHNGCLQMEVTVHGKMAHAAIPDTGVDALQGAVTILNALYAPEQQLVQEDQLQGRGHQRTLT
jgi:hypothetical protein